MRSGVEASKWSKDVRKAAIDKDMTLKQLADDIGYSYSVVSSVLNGRYSNNSSQAIVEKINGVLGTTGAPECISATSVEWQQAVRIALVKKNMSVTKLAEQVNVSRDRMSMVINGKLMNEEIINAVNRLLGIEVSAVPAGGN